MTTTTSRTRTSSLQESQRGDADIETYQPFQLSLGLAALLIAALVLVIAVTVGSHEAALALGAVVAIWLTNLIR
jgi:hypothetical protein